MKLARLIALLSFLMIDANVLLAQEHLSQSRPTEGIDAEASEEINSLPVYDATAVPIIDSDEMDIHSKIAIRTDLMSDVLLIPNIGVEMSLPDNWSVSTEFVYANWNNMTKHRYWDINGGRICIRKYFGEAALRRSFSGHHVGISTTAVAYNFCIGNLGQKSSTANIIAEVDYGYSFQLKTNLNLDLEAGIGYLNGKYHEYVVEDNHDIWRGTIRRNNIVPGKLSISLIWLINPKKYE
jgi:hypothetical protein